MYLVFNLIAVFSLLAVAVNCGPVIIELGSPVVQGPYANIDIHAPIHFNFSGETHRVVVGNFTIEITASNFTTASASDQFQFSAKGCIPTWMMKTNDEELGNKLKDDEYSLIIADGNHTEIFNKTTLDAFEGKKAMVASFIDNPFEDELHQQLFSLGVIVVRNLVRDKRLEDSKKYWSYMIVYDFANDQLKTFLSNVIMVEQADDYPFCGSDRQLSILTHSYFGEIPIYPGMIRPSVVDQDKGIINTYDHFGTHFDAPNHFYKDGQTIDQLDYSYSFVPCIKVEDPATDLHYLVGKSKFVEWEEVAGGKIPRKAMILVDTGNYKKWDTTDHTGYIGIDPSKNATTGFPGVSEEAVQWLLKDRQISSLGIDSLSPDNGAQKTFPDHVYLSKASNLIIENLANLGDFPNANGTFSNSSRPAKHPVGQCLIAYIRIDKASGAPVGIFAHLEDPKPFEQPSTSTAALPLRQISLSLLLAAALFVKTTLF